jgi:hypothetical protein
MNFFPRYLGKPRRKDSGGNFTFMERMLVAVYSSPSNIRYIFMVYSRYISALLDYKLWRFIMNSLLNKFFSEDAALEGVSYSRRTVADNGIVTYTNLSKEEVGVGDGVLIDDTVSEAVISDVAAYLVSRGMRLRVKPYGRNEPLGYVKKDGTQGYVCFVEAL